MSLRHRLSRAVGMTAVAIAACTGPLRASDHADTAQNAARPGADLSDVFIFPSMTNKNNVVLAMNSHPLIPAGGTASFDPNVVYQFKMDVTGDYVEDLVIQAKFIGNGASQRVVISGPYKPYTAGQLAYFGKPYATIGTINQQFTPTSGMTVFAGVRSDPFFFDLSRFFAILPDRSAPAIGQTLNYSSIVAADTPAVNGFRGFTGTPGDANHPTKFFTADNFTPASDLLSNLNVLSIVIELPRSALGGGKVNLWCTTNVATGAPNFQFAQQDRLARPAVNEALATVSFNRHMIINMGNPTDDRNVLFNDIVTFMTNPAGANRSLALAQTLATVLTPDVLVADLSNMTDPATYLGVETGGATGGKFGGRALTDDIIDTDLGAIFGGTLPFLFPSLEDGKELPEFATDNIGPHKDYLNVFPYLGNPH